MKFAIDDPQDGLAIESYTHREIVINGRVFRHSLALLPNALLHDGFPADLHALTTSHFTRLLELRPQLLLLGTGDHQRFPPAAVYAPMITAAIGVEVMSTPAACRTYNLLKSEGRRVCALLLLGDD